MTRVFSAHPQVPEAGGGDAFGTEARLSNLAADDAVHELFETAAAEVRPSRSMPYRVLLATWACDVAVVGLAGIFARIATTHGVPVWPDAAVFVVSATAAFLWLVTADNTRSGRLSFAPLGLRPAHLCRRWLHAFGLLLLVLLLAKVARNVMGGGGIPGAVSVTADDLAWLLLLFPVGMVFLLAGRMTLTRLLPADLDAHGRLRLRALVVGDSAHASRVFSRLRSASNEAIHAVGLVDPREAAPGRSLLDIVRREPIDAVVVAFPREAEQGLRGIVESLAEAPVDIWLAPDFAGAADPAIFATVTALPMLRIRARPLSARQLAVKKVEDMVVASLLLALAMPLMLVIAIAIRIDTPGPLLFRQTRRGYNERLIKVLKFRTMQTRFSDHDAESQAVRGDKRVTRVGRILRRFSLDELPQLFNVLRGEMSVVGPRPHALETRAAGYRFEEVVANYRARHQVKPGITGWAQVSGWRGETDTIEKIMQRVRCDMEYIENWSLARDIAIIFMTAARIFTDDEVY